MFSEEQLVDRLRSELAPLRPRGDLAEWVREQAGTDAAPVGRVHCRGRLGRFQLRARTLGLAGGVLAVVAIGVLMFSLTGHTSQPTPSPRPKTTSAVARAKPGAGPVTCQAGVCHQRRRLVRDPAGSTCGRGTWVTKTTAPETIYGCRQRNIETGY